MIETSSRSKVLFHFVVVVVVTGAYRMCDLNGSDQLFHVESEREGHGAAPELPLVIW